MDYLHSTYLVSVYKGMIDGATGEPVELRLKWGELVFCYRSRRIPHRRRGPLLPSFRPLLILFIHQVQRYVAAGAIAVAFGAAGVDDDGSSLRLERCVLAPCPSSPCLDACHVDTLCDLVESKGAHGRSADGSSPCSSFVVCMDSPLTAHSLPTHSPLTGHSVACLMQKYHRHVRRRAS